MGLNETGFEIKQMADGVYIELAPKVISGKTLNLDDVVQALLSKDYSEFDVDQLDQAIQKANEVAEKSVLFKIKGQSINQEAVGVLGGKNFRLRDTPDHMQMMMTLYRPDEDAGSTVEDVVGDIRKLKVVLPIDDDLIQKKMDEAYYNVEFCVAKGQPPVEAVPGYIEYHFKTEKDYKPEVDEQGNVNYHKLNVIASVEKGQVLATLHPGTEGQPGINLYGQPLKPKPLKPTRFKRGKNVILSDNQQQLLADANGLVKLEDGKVSVNDTYDVPNHVGSSTGDIEFHGSIIIHGNVMTGFTVKADGDIEVIGVVEGANVEAGGNIILHRGIQGMSDCKVIAGGNLQARYIENAEVIVGGNVHSEAILHSQVIAKGDVLVEGKKGMISGGMVRSGTQIASNILGSHMGTTTYVEVGIDPFVWEEYNTCLKELPKMKEEAQKLEQVMTLLNKRKELEGQLDEQKQAMYLSATRNKILISNKILMAEKRVEVLKEEVERRNDGKIIVRNILYPGVRVTIGNAKYYVRDEIKFVSLIKDGADVKLTSL